MQHQVLARKWRPRNFKEMVGQEHVLQALINALDQNRLHHAYLFTGTRGVGKTTIARILAKCLSCEKGVTSEPCGECSSCTEIAEGRSIDLIEVDAASRTKVEDTRELMDNVQYAPTQSRFKIYLIDEVHMLSTHSFNALLKTLEEPPPHVKFLLATTDPQKLPVTILSRCLQFNLKNMGPESIAGHLKHVLEQESVPFEESALWQLGHAAAGSMRDALSLTDQAIAFGENSVMATDVASMLGCIDRDQVYKLLDALNAEDGEALLAAVAEIAEFSPDYEDVLQALINLLHRVAIAQTIPGATDNARGDKKRVEAFAENMAKEDVQLFYQIALIGLRDLPINPDLRSGLEMVLLRMLAFRPEGASTGPKKKASSGAELAPSAIKAATQPIKTPASIPAQVTEPAPSAPSTQSNERSVPQTTGKKLDLVINNVRTPAPSPKQSGSARQAASAAASLAAQPQPQTESQREAQDQPQTKQKSAPVPDEQPEFIQESQPQLESQPTAVSGEAQALVTGLDWCLLVQTSDLKGMTRNITSQCAFVAYADNRLDLVIDPQYIDLLNKTHHDRMTDSIGRQLGVQLALHVTAGSSDNETPAAYDKRITQAKLAEATRILEDDEHVKCLIEQFGARIDVESIEVLDNAGPETDKQ